MKNIICFILIVLPSLIGCSSVKMEDLTADNLSKKMSVATNDFVVSETAFDFHIGKLSKNSVYFNDRFPLRYTNVSYEEFDIQNGNGIATILDNGLIKTYSFYKSKLIYVLVFADGYQRTQYIMDQILDEALKEEGYTYLRSNLKNGYDVLVKKIDNYYMVGELNTVIAPDGSKKIMSILLRVWKPIK